MLILVVISVESSLVLALKTLSVANVTDSLPSTIVILSASILTKSPAVSSVIITS